MPTRSVTFGKVSIQEYPIEIGDNPSCSSGVPIQIGWTPLSVKTTDIDTFESSRGVVRRLGRRDLIISLQDRVTMLINAGYSIHDIALVVTEIEQIQSARFESTEEARKREWSCVHNILETTNTSLKQAQTFPREIIASTGRAVRRIAFKQHVKSRPAAKV